MRQALVGKSFFFGCLFSIFVLLASVSAASAQFEDVDYFTKQLSSDSMQQRTNAAKRITRSGLTDPKLFDMIQDMLLKGYTGSPFNADLMDEMSWFCKALASSGDTAYAATLSQVASSTTSSKLKRHATKSLEQLNVYAKRNQIMNADLGTDDTLSTEEKKLIAMVRSQDAVLIRDASKMTYRNPLPGDAVTDAINDVLLKTYGNTSVNSRTMNDALAWMCKALGNSGKAKYRATLTEVIDKTTSDKLRKHAKKSIRLL